MNNLTTVLKNATASAPLALPLGRQDVFKVLRTANVNTTLVCVGVGIPVAGSVGAPFVLPELLVLAVDIYPELEKHSETAEVLI